MAFPFVPNATIYESRLDSLHDGEDMKQKIGKVYGGPLNGQMMAYWAKTKPIYRPAIFPRSLIVSNPTDEMRAVLMGTYSHGPGGWRWVPEPGEKS
jgi:hypothetical protein